MDVASVLIFLVLLWVALGTCFPQRTLGLDSEPNRLAQWDEGIRNRYGGFVEPLRAVGVFKLYKSPLFITSFVLLAASSLVCTLNRWKAIWRRVFNPDVRCADTLFEMVEHSGKFILKEVEDIKIFQELLEARGMRVCSDMNEDIHHFRADRYRFSPLGSLVSHLGVVLLLGGTIISSTFGWRGEVIIEPDQDVSLPAFGWHIFNEGFKIERYPDGNVASYVAQVKITSPGQVIAQGEVRPNEPLNVGTRGIYLMGFLPAEEGVAITLQIVQDPGYGLVLTAGFLVLLGMVVSFNFPHCCIFARLEPDGTLCLAGRADRRAYDFGSEFQALISQLEAKIPEIKKGDITPC
jgi:cytochrome c biogenesis protein